MPQHDILPIIEQIHAAPHRLVLEFAGAGSLALWWLHSVGGSSRTVLEATDRYSAASLRDVLGSTPAQAVAVPTAHDMAQQAYRRAQALSDSAADEQAPLLGVACTAAIATDYAKRGAHHCMVGICRADECMVDALTLAKGRRDRAGEETMVSRFVLASIARACGLSAAVPLELAEGETVAHYADLAPEKYSRLAEGAVQHIIVYPDGRQTSSEPFQGALLSGAFNPLHQGHIRLAEAAAAHSGVAAAFELPIVNADKGTLAAEETNRRVWQFAGQHTLILSREPLFVGKARLFPGSIFVVGYDTAIRLVNPRYYGGTEGMHAALEDIRACGCRFLVAGRAEGQRFLTLDDIDLPAAFRDMFVGLPESAFRVDISSTELRQQAASSSS
jgi:hypothetical protein